MTHISPGQSLLHFLTIKSPWITAVTLYPLSVQLNSTQGKFQALCIIWSTHHAVLTLSFKFLNWQLLFNFNRGTGQQVMKELTMYLGTFTQVRSVLTHFSISKPSLKKIIYGVTPSSRKSRRATIPSGFIFSPTKNFRGMCYWDI